MNSNLHRIGAILLLLVALLTLSGVVATAEALVHADSISACCDGDADSKDTDSGPCAVPDCPCATCLTIDFSAPPRAIKVNVSADLCFSPHRPSRPLQGFIGSIDYPPESLRDLVA